MFPKFLLTGLSFAAMVSPTWSAEPAKPTYTQATFEQTITGQPLVLPQGPVKVSFRLEQFPAGWKGPLHKQPYPRYAYVISGRLRVTYEDQRVVREFGPGDTMIEGVDQWHWVEPVGDQAVKVLVVDQTPPGKPDVIIKRP